MKRRPYTQKQRYKRYVSKWKRNRTTGQRIRHYAFISFIVVMLLWCSASIFQMLRYDRENYACVEMSNDCEVIFEKLGFDTIQKSGHRYEDGEIHGHRWLSVKLPFLGYVDFESTALMFYPVSNNWGMIETTEGVI